MGPARDDQAFALETPFSFDSDWSATLGCYVKINVANDNVMSFFIALKVFHVCICNRFENTLMSLSPKQL
jgi:hypothetical protein